MNNWSGKKKVFAVFAAVLAVIGLIITIFLVQKVQEIRSRAEKATVLSLSPTNQNVEPSEEAEMDIVINPGKNQVNFVKLSLKFDPDKLDLRPEDFELNQDLSLNIIDGPSVLPEEGEFSLVLSVEADPTKVITSPQKLGSITFSVKEEAEDGETEVSFDEEKTQIRSVGGGDPFTQNVLSSTVPATITIGAPICKPNIATCSWKSTDSGVTFHYKITDTEDDSIVSEGDTEEKKVEFPSEPGKTYKCEVSAVSVCGESPLAEGQSTCPSPTPTPTPSPSPSPSPSPTKKITPSPTEEITPSPTEEIILTIVPSLPTASPTQPAGGVEEVTTTPIPTLPPTGNPLVIGGILGGILFVIGGLALLFL